MSEYSLLNATVFKDIIYTILSNIMLKAIVGTVIATTALLTSTSVAVAQQTAVQTITVTVPGLLTIELTEPAPNLDPLNSTALVGDFIIRSNQRNGYSVSLSSANSSRLENADKSFGIAYTLSVGAQQTFDGPQGQGTSGTTLTLPNTLPGIVAHTSVDFATQKCASQVGCRNGVELTLEGVPSELVPPDTYVDTITYTLSAQ